MMLLWYCKEKFSIITMHNSLAKFQWLIMLLFNTEVSPVVSSQISTNPGLNFNPGSFIPLFKSLFQIIFVLFLLGLPIMKLWSKQILLNFLLKLSNLKSYFTLTLGYCNPAWKYLAVENILPKVWTISLIAKFCGEHLGKAIVFW